ncbi:tail assembly chaperone [Metabacillus fastidiosus]|uniref:tail assembly chaperone n=1 Tax=Metabacillus fastidiosus TaxID=1458 RepID=UPI000826D886|nr:tail assembly chaperone [Metabacillus fastidiosus]MED4461864.1 tail assembly chaperone [Metabacillus fastidiosus]
MAVLTVKGRELEGKCTFKFDKLADKKYAGVDKDGNETGGFHNIYMNLLQYSNKHLLAFWDCALDYLKKDKPSLEEIEEAIEDRFEEDGGTEEAFKEAFKAIDESAFFGKQARNFWRDLELLKETGVDEEEKATNFKAYNMMIAARDELKA